MALIITAWETSGAGHAEIKHIRSDQKNYTNTSIKEFIAYWSSISDCSLITKSRTDKQSNWEEILFERLK